MCKGNTTAVTFSEVCFPEPERRGVAISRFAEVYTLVIKRFTGSPYSKVMIKEEAYQQITEEADRVLLLLSKLNHAYMAQRQVKTIRNAVYVKPSSCTQHTAVHVQQATRLLYAWRSKDSIIRSILP